MSEPQPGAVPGPRPGASPATLGPSADGHDPAVDAALRHLDEAAASDDPQAQIAAAQRVHDVLQGRLSGVAGS